jgi:hypothetical protein
MRGFRRFRRFHTYVRATLSNLSLPPSLPFFMDSSRPTTYETYETSDGGGTR